MVGHELYNAHAGFGNLGAKTAGKPAHSSLTTALEHVLLEGSKYEPLKLLDVNLCGPWHCFWLLCGFGAAPHFVPAPAAAAFNALHKARRAQVAADGISSFS